MAFITLAKRNVVSGRTEALVTVSVETITRMERDDEYAMTDVYMADGTSFTVQESPAALVRMIRDARWEERDGG